MISEEALLISLYTKKPTPLACNAIAGENLSGQINIKQSINLLCEGSRRFQCVILKDRIP